MIFKEKDFLGYTIGAARYAVQVALIFTALSAFSATPVMTLDFSKVTDEDGAVVSDQRNYMMFIDDGAKIKQGGPTGKPYLEFDGSAAAPVRVDGRKAATKLDGREVSMSFWFRADKFNDALIAFGYKLRKWPTYDESHISMSVTTIPSEFGSYNIWSRFETPFSTGTWHHVAFQYSVSNLYFKSWFDGNLERSVKITADQPQPLKDFFGIVPAPESKDGRFFGAIADIKVWNVADPGDDLLAIKVSQPVTDMTVAAFTSAAAKVPGNKPFATWALKQAKLAKSMVEKQPLQAQPWFRIQEYLDKLPTLTKWATEQAKLPAAADLAKAPFMPINIYEYDQTKRLPWKLPYDGKPIDTIQISAALGEFEGFAFMAFPYEDVPSFHMTVSELTGPGGAKLPAETIDIRVIKVWYTSAGGWSSYFGGGREFGTLTPELLLHDDYLVKVVPGERKNFLRIDYPRGARYVDISQFGTPENIEILNFNREPIHDATEFKPLPLEEGRMREFWLTAHIPSNAVPGKYTGTLSFTAAGLPVGSMKLALNVYPFKLPFACTRYNTEAPFTGTWMHQISLANKLGASMSGNSFSNAYRRLYAEYKNMSEHNCVQAWGQSADDETTRDLAAIQIKIMRETGQRMRPFWGGGSGADSKWGNLGHEADRYPNRDISVDALPQLFSERMNAFTNHIKSVMDFYKKELGHTEVYFYGFDEAGPGMVRREMPFFATIRHFGGRVFITSGIAEWAAYAVDADDSPASFGRTHARNWHEGGATVHTYAAPFSGPENPELWRRNKGMRLYMANFDGGNEYQWYGSVDVWNEFVYNDRYRPFVIVYPTADGVIDTIAWEGEREGYDDVRYMTLLRRLAKTALRSGEKSLQRLGRGALAFAEIVDPDSDDLDTMRATAANWIIKLQNALMKSGAHINHLYE